MSLFSDIHTIYEFSNEGRISGAYYAKFKGEGKLFIRNGNSVGVVVHYLNEPASHCVGIIHDELRDEFLRLLETEKEV